MVLFHDVVLLPAICSVTQKQPHPEWVLKKGSANGGLLGTLLESGEITVHHQDSDELSSLPVASTSLGAP